MAVTSLPILPGVSATTFATTPESHGEASPNVMKFFMVPLYSIVCLIGLLGNALVMYIIQTRQKSITDIYVINLAVADFIFLSMLPFWTTELAMDKRWIFGRVLCKLTSFSTHFHMYASVFFLTAMAVDRLLAVVFYQSNENLRTGRGASISAAFIWIFAITISAVPFYFRDQTFNNSTGYNLCTWTFDEKIANHREWFIVHFITRSVVGFGLPCIIIAACYTTIAIFLKRRNTSGKLTNKRQNQATTTVVTVIAVFFFCWIPNQISNAVYSLQALELIEAPPTLSIVHYYIHVISTMLAWGHSCVNPLLYFVMREDMKLKIAEILHSSLTCCCGKALADRLLISDNTAKKSEPESDKHRTKCYLRCSPRTEERDERNDQQLVQEVHENEELPMETLKIVA